jgi:hypothetical protein
MRELTSTYPIKNFLNEEEEGKKVKTLILGNGFCRDHPILGKCFEFDKKKASSLLKKI